LKPSFISPRSGLAGSLPSTHRPSGGRGTESQQPTFTALPDGGTDGSIVRLESWHMHSAILPDDRNVHVYLPPQYATEPDRRFPVFYLHDGQNLFDPHTSYLPGRTWHAGQAADRTNADGSAEPVILIGANNTGLRRMAEYTPTRDLRMGGGDGARYGRLLTEELKPFIDRTYRTKPEARATGVGGSSLGGLISLYLGLERPDVFSRIAVLSPSIWWDHRSILTFVQNARPKPALHIWLDIGTGEGARHVRDTELLNRMLIRDGWKMDVDLKLLIVPGALHDEDAWAARFDQVLEFLFPSGAEPGPEAC
jgi:predicted alpha/beta superfamily hydrolase